MSIMRFASQTGEWQAERTDYCGLPYSDVIQMSRFEGLYEKYVSAVFLYCLRQVGRRDLAEDIASEVFLTLYQKLEQVEDQHLPAWPFTVAKNKTVDYWRHEAVATRYKVAQPETPTGSEPDISFEAMLRQNKALKPVHRLCLTLRYVHGLNRTEIAQQTGLSETQIKGHLQYALKLLRQSFSEV